MKSVGISGRELSAPKPSHWPITSMTRLKACGHTDLGADGHDAVALCERVRLGLASCPNGIERFRDDEIAFRMAQRAALLKIGYLRAGPTTVAVSSLRRATPSIVATERSTREARFDKLSNFSKAMPHAVESPEQKKSTQRLGQHVREAIPRHDRHHRRIQRIRDVSCEGRRTQRRASHARHSKSSNLIVLGREEILLGQANPQASPAGGRHDQDRALTRKPKAEAGVSASGLSRLHRRKPHPGWRCVVAEVRARTTGADCPRVSGEARLRVGFEPRLSVDRVDSHLNPARCDAAYHIQRCEQRLEAASHSAGFSRCVTGA